MHFFQTSQRQRRLDRVCVTPLLFLLTWLLCGISTVNAQDHVEIEVVNTVECERKTQAGDTIHVHYTGTLKDGTIFDSSYRRNSPIVFKLANNEVIQGWDQGLMDMCIGEERNLEIPPSLAYGHRAVGSIPADSTLYFATKLMSVDNVVEDTSPTPEETSKEEQESPQSSVNADQAGADQNGECRLLGPFALFVQGGLGLLAVLSLVWKRYRERPRRPLKIWFFDASKQVFGSALLHVANLLMSMVSSGSLDFAAKAKEAAQTPDEGRQPNPCSFYLVNIAVDTTIGIAILVFILRLLHHAASITPLARPPQSIKSGHYGEPPKATWWLKQSIIYFIGLVIMKLCVFLLFQLLPWIAWVGDWALRWTEGSEALQITFVMFVFPLIMNALQYYIIDSFIKDPNAGSGHEALPTDEPDEDDESYQPLNGGQERYDGSRESGEDSKGVGDVSAEEMFVPVTPPGRHDKDDQDEGTSLNGKRQQRRPEDEGNTER